MANRLTREGASATEQLVEPDAEDGGAAPGRRRRIPRMTRTRAVAAALALALLAALLIVWTQRRPIATGYVDRELARRGVPARYRITEVGIRTQRLEDVVIGDPGRPDLVADWVEVVTQVGFGVPEVVGLRAGKVRVRARLEDGRLRLGALDKLLPAPSGKPFALPEIDADVADARVRLETPLGVVGVKLSGAGGLSDGFAGRLAAVAERLDGGGCRVDRAVAALAVRIRDGQPSLSGPVRAMTAACGGGRASAVGLALDGMLGEGLDRWRGRLGLEVGRLSAGTARLERLEGVIGFDGGPARTTGEVTLATRALATTQVTATSSSLEGQYRAGSAGYGFDGSVVAEGAMLPRSTMTMLTGLGRSAAGTPVGPLLAQAGAAAARAGQSMRLEARVALASAQGRAQVAARQLSAVSASGATATLWGGDGVSVSWPGARSRVDGRLALSGGGLPALAATVRQGATGRPVTGTAVIQPYRAPGAAAVLTPVTFRADGDGTRIATRATLSGPLADGRVERLSAPVELVWDGARRLRINPACTPVSFARLQVSSLVLGQTALKVCPIGTALVAMNGASIAGSVNVARPRLAGMLGGTPLRLDAESARYELAGNRFALAGVRSAIGSPERVTRIDAERLDGQVAAGRISGGFAGGSGQIANVPLLLSKAAGAWRFAGGRLQVTGGTGVADADPAPRFAPLVAPELRLVLAGNRITATGPLQTPEGAVRVADVAISHDLGTGRGQADLGVQGLAFGDGFQPADLSRFALGVVADVRGTVSGAGQIRWSPEGVTSTGTFRTSGTELAAAFGPVSGLSGEIRFTDLLSLESAPGQVVRLAEVNPGIAVTDGLIRYQLKAGQKVMIEGGEWPFAGGKLVLEPALLDFGQAGERRMTFRVAGVDAALFLQQFEFENLFATGTFDGTMPIVFGGLGARIEGGALTVREGGGTIAYVGELTEKDLGFWGNVAFQALKSLRYRDLSIQMNGPLEGEMLTAVRFSGVSQGEGTTSNFLIRRLTKLPFRFNVNVRAPFRQLVDSVRSYYEPSRLIERNLPALLDAAPEDKPQPGATPTPDPTPARPVQPPESEMVP